MNGLRKNGLTWLTFGAIALLGETTSAQMSPTIPSGGTFGSPASTMANPALNPYLNPYMNPFATGQPANSNNMLLYLYAANNANGGLGTGRISGTRGGAVAPRPRPAEMGGPMSYPGGGAARYFNPGQGVGPGAGRYYNQRGRYFQNNGR